VYVLAVPQTPPLFNAYSLPLPRRRQGPAAALSLLVHVAIGVVVLWRGAVLLGGGGGSGPRGGGGGGGQPAVTWFTLPAGVAPQALDVPAAPAVTVPSVALPDPVKIDVRRSSRSRRPPAARCGGRRYRHRDDGRAGAGPRVRGGQGTGTGPGRGSDAGPGSGGDASYILPATPRWAIFPPPGAPSACGDTRTRCGSG